MTLMKISQLIIDFPEIVELDINPLFADAEGVLALDARIRVTANCLRPRPHGNPPLSEIARGNLLSERRPHGPGPADPP